MKRRLAAAGLAVLVAGPGPARGEEALFDAQAATVLPGRPLEAFGTGAVDENAGLYYLPDRSNAAVAVLDTRSGAYRGRLPGFTGLAQPAARVGPNAALAVDRMLWASDGDGTVKVFDMAADPPRWRTNVSLGALTRADQLAYDPQDHLVAVTSPAEQPPFLSLVASRGHLRVVARINFTGGIGALGQPLFDGRTRRFIVGMVGGGRREGVLAVVDPQRRAVQRFLPLGPCVPTSLAPGPGRQLLVTCGDGAGTPALTVNVETGETGGGFSQAGAAASAAFDRNRQRWLILAADPAAGLGVVDAVRGTWLGAVATGPGAHSVAVDSVTGRVFVPHGPDAACPQGCVAVLTPPSWLPPIGG